MAGHKSRLYTTLLVAGAISVAAPQMAFAKPPKHDAKKHVTHNVLKTAEIKRSSIGQSCYDKRFKKSETYSRQKGEPTIIPAKTVLEMLNRPGEPTIIPAETGFKMLNRPGEPTIIPAAQVLDML